MYINENHKADGVISSLNKVSDEVHKGTRATE
jgi:hypothetical protein